MTAAAEVATQIDEVTTDTPYDSTLEPVLAHVYEVVEYIDTEKGPSGKRCYRGPDRAEASAAWGAVPFGIVAGRVGVDAWRRLAERRSPKL